MRLVFKCLMVVLIVLGIGNYLVYLKTGSLPLGELGQHVKRDWLGAAKNYTPEHLALRAKQTLEQVNFNQNDQSASTKVYTWTDANGHVHFSDQPTNSQAEAVTIEMRNAISPAEQHDPISPTQNDAQPQTPIEKARAAAEAINARTRAQENL